MQKLWTCPNCQCAFRQTNQRHSCGVGDRSSLVRGRDAELVRLYGELEKVVLGFEGVEIVYRDKYALFRTSRIFADLVMMKDAPRLAVHLNRDVDERLFFKVVTGERGRVSQVAKIKTEEELRAIAPYLAEGHQVSMGE